MCSRNQAYLSSREGWSPSSESDTSAIVPFASRIAHPESSNPGEAAAGFELTPTLQPLFNTIGEPIPVASTTGPSGVLCFSSCLAPRPAGGECGCDCSARPCTAQSTRPAMAHKNARRTSPPQFSAVLTTLIHGASLSKRERTPKSCAQTIRGHSLPARKSN